MERFVAHKFVIAIALSLAGVAHAEPKLEMHRVAATADDGSGWHRAVSTNGSFAVLMPIPFNDFTTRDAATGETSYGVGGKSSEGIKFSAVEIVLGGGKPPPDLESVPQTLSATADNKVSDVIRSSNDGSDMLGFTVVNAKVTAYMRCIQMRGMRYLLSIEFPNAQRDQALKFRDRFFESFKLKTKS